jgi:hypothetical protein
MKAAKHPATSAPWHPGEVTRLVVPALALAVLAGFLAGCLPTAVHPFYQVADLVQDPGLLGVWRTAEGKDGWTFTQGEGKSYTLEIQIDDQRVVCAAHLFRLGNDRFLDLYPAERALGANLENNPYGIGLVPAHGFLRVHDTTSKLRMSCMGLDWLKERLKRDPRAAAHVMLPDGRVVLTGETEALQAFVKEHINNADAWNTMYEDGLVRVVATPANT